MVSRNTVSLAPRRAGICAVGPTLQSCVLSENREQNEHSKTRPPGQAQGSIHRPLRRLGQPRDRAKLKHVHMILA